MEAKKKRKSTITRRWVRGSLLLTILVLLAVEGVLIFYFNTYYYSSARAAVMTRVNTVAGQLSALSGAEDSERSATLRRMAEDFSEKDKFEFMLINTAGKVVSTSSGFVPDYIETLDDFNKAKQSTDGIGEFVGTDSTGEHIMAVTYLVPKPAGGIMAVRFVTGLSRIDNQIMMLIAISAAVVLVILLFTIFSGTYFIRSIVLPVSKVEQAATKIASGDFGARIDNVYDDELGRLCDTINHMAEELSKTDQLKNEFISSVSHELRTPLTSIKGWVETLARVDDPTSENYKKGVRVILSETDRLYQMVEELLDFSRMQNGGLVLAPELLDLGAEVDDALLMAGPRAQNEGVQLCFEEPELPCPVWADKNRLRQVFLNLLDNALKYSPGGCTIALKLAVQGEQAVVEIQDEGPGIAPEDLAHIKTKFYKGRGAVRGSGIGLAVVDEIVAAHGGRFDIESNYGHGTLVRVSLPLKKAAPRPLPPAGENGPERKNA